MVDAAKDKTLKDIYKQTIVDGRKVVAAAATAEPLEDSANIVNFVVITAETNNTGVVTVGASTVVAAVATRRGTPLAKGASMSLGGVDLNEVYLDVTVSGDGVTYTYLK